MARKKNKFVKFFLDDLEKEFPEARLLPPNELGVAFAGYLMAAGRARNENHQLRKDIEAKLRKTKGVDSQKAD